MLMHNLYHVNEYSVKCFYVAVCSALDVLDLMLSYQRRAQLQVSYLSEIIMRVIIIIYKVVRK